MGLTSSCSSMNSELLPPSAISHMVPTARPLSPGLRGRGVGQMAPLTSRRWRRAGGRNTPRDSSGCEANPVLNPVSRVVPNHVLAAGHPRGHPTTKTSCWSARTSTPFSSFWSTWTRRLKIPVLVHVDQEAHFQIPRVGPRGPTPRKCALWSARTSKPKSAGWPWSTWTSSGWPRREARYLRQGAPEAGHALPTSSAPCYEQIGHSAGTHTWRWLWP